MKRFRIRTAILFLSIFSATMSAAEGLPPIDAQRFDVKPIQKSTSGKIYLFESQVIPKTGNLILVYDHEKPAMAFRILKNDSVKKTFVGKRVRRYDQTSDLNLKETYSSLEKLADALPPPPVEVAKEELDDEVAPAPVATPAPTPEPTPVPTPTPVQEVPPPAAQDSQLDSDSSAALDKMEAATPYNESDMDDEEDSGPMEIEETTHIDPYNNILSVTAGYFGNSSNFSGSSILSNGFSMSYAHVLFHDVFISKKSPQDSLAVEVGGIYYRIINRDGGNDLYSMLPFYGNLLYQLNTSESFSVNLYGGIQYNYMTSASNPGASLKLLQGPQPTFGIGAFFRVGPQWYLRADAGWDRITGGLCIKW